MPKPVAWGGHRHFPGWTRPTHREGHPLLPPCPHRVSVHQPGCPALTIDARWRATLQAEKPRWVWGWGGDALWTVCRMCDSAPAALQASSPPPLQQVLPRQSFSSGLWKRGRKIPLGCSLTVCVCLCTHACTKGGRGRFYPMGRRAESVSVCRVWVHAVLGGH